MRDLIVNFISFKQKSVLLPFYEPLVTLPHHIHHLYTREMAFPRIFHE